MNSKLVSRLKNHRHSVGELEAILKVPKAKIIQQIQEIQNDPSIKIESRNGRYHIKTTPEVGNVYVLSKADNKERDLRFAAASDFHFASLFHMQKTFHEAMKATEDAGIKRVYVAGDIVDGRDIYHGHLENIVHPGVERQTDMAAEAFSQHPNLEFWAIAGNHDFSFTKKAGVRPLNLVEQKAENFKDLGDLRADVVYHGIRIRLLHGAGGRAYATSYPSQTYLRDLFKGMEREEFKDTPHIIILGHYHTFYQGKDHGIHILQPGSFQDSENEYCIRRGLTGPNGLFHVKAKYKNGVIEGFQTEYIQPKIAKKEKGRLCQGKRIKLE